MLDSLQLIALAPILLWQGRKVRQRTLRLPEAAGWNCPIKACAKS